MQAPASFFRVRHAALEQAELFDLQWREHHKGKHVFFGCYRSKLAKLGWRERFALAESAAQSVNSILAVRAEAELRQLLEPASLVISCTQVLAAKAKQAPLAYEMLGVAWRASPFAFHMLLLCKQADAYALCALFSI